MSTVNVSEERQREIIRVLCEANAFCDCSRCGCNGNGVSFNDLLISLESEYPEASWTQLLVLLATNYGRKRGLYVVQGDLIYININMALVNPSNQKYQNECSVIKKKYNCTTTVSSLACGASIPGKCTDIFCENPACHGANLPSACDDPLNADVPCYAGKCTGGNRTQ